MRETYVLSNVDPVRVVVSRSSAQSSSFKRSTHGGDEMLSSDLVFLLMAGLYKER